MRWGCFARAETGKVLEREGEGIPGPRSMGGETARRGNRSCRGLPVERCGGEGEKSQRCGKRRANWWWRRGGDKEEEVGRLGWCAGRGEDWEMGNRGGGFSRDGKMVEMEEDELGRRMTCGRRRNWRRWRPDGLEAAAVEAQGRRRQRWHKGGGGGGFEDGGVCGDNGEEPVARATSGGDRRGCDGGTEACGDGGGSTPSPAFREQPLEMEETPFFVK